jgi:hypothetical protein
LSIAKVAAQLMLNKPGLSYLDALKKAQEQILPVSRRRTIVTLITVPWYEPLIKKQLEEQRKALFHNVETKIIEKYVTIPLVLSDVSTEDLLGEIMKRLFKQQIDNFWSKLHVSFDDMVKKELVRRITMPPEQVKVGPKKILIVGLLPEQQNEIIKEFRDCFKLYFWKDGHTKQLRDIATNCEKVYLMRKFISHSAQDIVKAANTSVDVIQGGMSDLKTILEEYYLKN